MSRDPYGLHRFVEAQAPIYNQALKELRGGRKQSHWMWFIFPQLRGLGHSAMAYEYGISALAEAIAYLQHPLLGPRLRECTKTVNSIDGRTVSEIFGSPDDLKFRSSMTLFANATPDNVEFLTALERYFGGKQDPRTLALL